MTPLAVWLLAPFVVFRLTGKMIGAWAAARVLPVGAGDLAAYLMPPGLLGIALAINFLDVSATPTAVAVATAVALGTLASEALAVCCAAGAVRRLMRRAAGLLLVLLVGYVAQRAAPGEPADERRHHAGDRLRTRGRRHRRVVRRALRAAAGHRVPAASGWCADRTSST